MGNDEPQLLSDAKASLEVSLVNWMVCGKLVYRRAIKAARKWFIAHSRQDELQEWSPDCRCALLPAGLCGVSGEAQSSLILRDFGVINFSFRSWHSRRTGASVRWAVLVVRVASLSHSRAIAKPPTKCCSKSFASFNRRRNYFSTASIGNRPTRTATGQHWEMLIIFYTPLYIFSSMFDVCMLYVRVHEVVVVGI